MSDGDLNATESWAMVPGRPFLKQQFPIPRLYSVGPGELNIPLPFFFLLTILRILNIQ